MKRTYDELKEKYTVEEGKLLIDEIMKKYGETCEVHFLPYAADMIDSYKVTSHSDRLKICEIIRRTDITKRSDRNLAAEWMVHNVAWYLGIGKASAKDASLDYGEDPRLPVRLATEFFYILRVA